MSDLGINLSDPIYNKYFNTNSIDNRYKKRIENQNMQSYNDTDRVAWTVSNSNCPDFSTCKCQNGKCMGEYCSKDRFGNDICVNVDCASIKGCSGGPTEIGPGETSCGRCLPNQNDTTMVPEYQVTSTSAGSNQGSGAGSNQGSGGGSNQGSGAGSNQGSGAGSNQGSGAGSNQGSGAGSNQDSGAGSKQGSGNFVTINVPDNLLTNPGKMDDIINNIDNYLSFENIDVLNTYKHYENRGTTTEPITTSQSSQNNSFNSNNANNGQTSRQKVIGLVNNLTVEELKELMILLMDVDLDQTDSSSSNVFNMLDAVKRALMYNYNSQEEVENQLATHQVKSVEHLKNKLKQLDPKTYNALFGKDRTHKYNTTYIPGFQYTPPELWPLHQYKAPVCIQDKSKVSDPVFVFDKGTPVNALDYEGLRQLPEFVYYESQTRDEAEAIQANKMIANLCQTVCSRNCDLPICKSLNCSNCTGERTRTRT